MAQTSEEGTQTGLGWLDADVRRFRFDPRGSPARAAHGLGGRRPTRPSPLARRPRTTTAVLLLARLPPGLQRPGRRRGDATYGYEFPAAVHRGNILGTQFHPEKSHVFGLDVYRRFLALSTAMIPRVIPCLLLGDGGLVKTVSFQDPRYVGDPINAVRIFNDKQADELVGARHPRDGRRPRPERGGHRGDRRAKRSCRLPTAAVCAISRRRPPHPGRGREGRRQHAPPRAPSSSSRTSPIIWAARRSWSPSTRRAVGTARTRSSTQSRHATDRASTCEPTPRRWPRLGAGELFLTFDRPRWNDGRLRPRPDPAGRERGRRSPVVACGGAGSTADLVTAVRDGGAAAVAAGSLFVFHGRHRAVLITYPSYEERLALFAREATSQSSEAGDAIGRSATTM